MAATSVRRPWVLVLLAVALVATVLLVSISGDDTSPASAPVPSATATAETPEPTPEPGLGSTSEGTAPDAFCTEFLRFVDASSTYTSRLDVASGEALVEVARDLFALPTPIGMSPGARASLDQLVAGTLPQVEGAGIAVDAAPDPANDAEPDQAAFDAYLQATCPA